MDWTQAVDIYCERLGPGLLAEPLNAVSNAAFFVAAWFGLSRARREGKLEPATWLLVGLLVAIGVGSTLFHTFAQRWASLADVLPITLFILSYFALTMRRYFGMSWAESAAMTLGFLFFSSGFSASAEAALPEVLARSAQYYPALVALLACGGLLWARRHAAGPWLVATGSIFAASLTFRALDLPLCEVWPTGTHYGWHVLNSVVLGVALLAWLRHGARPAARETVAARTAAA